MFLASACQPRALPGTCDREKKEGQARVRIKRANRCEGSRLGPGRCALMIVERTPLAKGSRKVGFATFLRRPARTEAVQRDAVKIALVDREIGS